MKNLQTRDVLFPASNIEYAGTQVVADTIKSTEEVVKEMRTWLKTGIAPDGTRMMTDEASQWYQDFYQATLQADPEHECLPEGSCVDYYYWTAPFLAHIGNMDLLMMHSQVNLRDDTHLPCDRLREATRLMKNLDVKAAKRLAAQERERQQLIEEMMHKRDRAHPLYKAGMYTKVFWEPLHQKTIRERQRAAEIPQKLPTVIHEARKREMEEKGQENTQKGEDKNEDIKS